MESRTNFDNVGGIKEVKEELQKLVGFPMLHHEIFAHLGVDPPRGVLLCGPPGCGKTALAHALCGQLDEVPFFKLSGPSVVSSLSGESEQNIREIFEEVVANAPSVLFIDEIDSIAGKRENSAKDMEKRIVAQLVSSMDDLEQCPKPVIIIAATSRPESLDSSLRRAGRFDREIILPVPTQEDRHSQLQIMTKKMKVEGKQELLLDLSKNTPGYVPADL